ncbi:condensation domain-containing protein [Actinoplanes sp. M2I2]|uniref:condensation domain-containing protein n=1 Tax=Actinoplanes sp. M2I2 TaxID=1734444 RepID=UPI0020201996|nr:condensation domain-containing protein [Actinoplanes sp. M2I2]
MSSAGVFQASGPGTQSSGVLRPLGAFERLYYRYAERNPLHFTVAAEFRVSLDEKRVRAALAAVQERHPLLSAHIEDLPDTRLTFVRSRNVRSVGLTKIQQRSSEWRSHAADELSRPFNRSEAPLMRAVLVGDGEGSTILLTFDHTVADGISAIRIMRDLVMALNDHPLTPLTLPPSQEEMLARSLPESDRRIPEAKDGDRRLVGPATLRPFDRSAAPDIHTAELTAAETGRLIQRCRAEGTTVNALITAVASGVRAKERTEQFVRTVTNINFRSLIGAGDDCVDYLTATRTGMAPHDGSTVWDQARVIGKDIAAARSPAGIGGASALTQQFIPADAGSELAESFMVGALSYEIMISNLGVQDIPDVGPVRPHALWGPILLCQVEGEYVTGVTTYDGRLRFVTCAHDSVSAFVDELRAALVSAGD